LVEINGKPKIKLSQDVEKVTMPGKKNVFRLYSNDGHALIDLVNVLGLHLFVERIRIKF
jgi:nicotinate phosphoribosyltransferase